MIHHRINQRRSISRWVAGLLVSLLSIGVSATVDGPTDLYRERALTTVTSDVSDLGLRDCRSLGALDAARVLAICRAADPAAKPGLRLFLIGVEPDGQQTLLFRSPDFADAYYVEVTVLGRDQGEGPVLVLAEFGAEFSYGIQVYVLDGSTLRLVGTLDEVLDDEGNAGSAIPALRIEHDGRTVVFSFTTTVMRPDLQGNYAAITPGDLRYVLDGFTLRRILTTPEKSPAR